MMDVTCEADRGVRATEDENQKSQSALMEWRLFHPNTTGVAARRRHGIACKDGVRHDARPAGI